MPFGIPDWISSSDEVGRMARDMLEAGRFDARGSMGEGTQRDTATNLLEFMEKPHHWNREHTWWVANEWPDTAEMWDRGEETNFEVTT